MLRMLAKVLLSLHLYQSQSWIARKFPGAAENSVRIIIGTKKAVSVGKWYMAFLSLQYPYVSIVCKVFTGFHDPKLSTFWSGLVQTQNLTGDQRRLSNWTKQFGDSCASLREKYQEASINYGEKSQLPRYFPGSPNPMIVYEPFKYSYIFHLPSSYPSCKPNPMKPVA